MRIYKSVRRKWQNAVVYEGISPDFSNRIVDAVSEKDGKIYYQQVYPAWKAYPIRVVGHTGTPLAEKAAREIQEETVKEVIKNAYLSV